MMKNQNDTSDVLSAKRKESGLDRFLDDIQDILFERILPPVEKRLRPLEEAFRKRFKGKQKDGKKPSKRKRPPTCFSFAVRIVLCMTAVVMVLWNGWAIVRTGASLYDAEKKHETAQVKSSGSANSLQCAIEPIELRAPDKPGGAGKSEAAGGANEQKDTNAPALFVQNGRRRIPIGAFTHHSRFEYSLHGISVDVSNHQTDIDWQKVAATDVNAAMVRVGYRGSSSGKIFADNSYADNIKGALQNGLPVGVYFYSQSITPEEAREEADFILKKIDGFLVTLPVAIDFEFANDKEGGQTGRLYDANLSREERNLIAEAFCEKISAAGYTPMVYGNDDMLSKHMYVEKLGKKIKIWLASYHKKAVYEGEYFFWQFTNHGVVDGIDGLVCLDFWYR